MPYAFQQPGLGLRHDGQRAVPPHIKQEAHSNAGVGVHSHDLRVKGLPTSLRNPFAIDFGENAKAATAATHANGRKNYATMVASVRYMTHKDACAKWLLFGMCRDPHCDRLHDNWPMNLNGEVLNSKFRDFAQLASVPQNWQPRGHRP